MEVHLVSMEVHLVTMEVSRGPSDAAKRQMYEENSAAIRYLKGVGIGMTLMLSDWLNVCNTQTHPD